jgi:hypothetical protein
LERLYEEGQSKEAKRAPQAAAGRGRA